MADYGKMPPTVFTVTDVLELLAVCNTQSPSGCRDKAMLALTFSTAARVHEVLNLADHDIEMSGDHRGRVTINHGKCDKQRVVYVDDGTLGLVEQWITVRDRLGIASDYLFCTISKPEPGEQLGYDHVRTMLRRRFAKVSRKRAHWHGLRHGQAVDMLIRGCDLATIRDFLGHEHLSTTDTYLRGLMPMDVQVAGRSNNWLESA